MDEINRGFDGQPSTAVASKADVELVANIIEKLQGRFESRVDRLESNIAILQSTLNNHARAILFQVTQNTSPTASILRSAPPQQPQNTSSQKICHDHLDGIDFRTPPAVQPDAGDSAKPPRSGKPPNGAAAPPAAAHSDLAVPAPPASA